MAGRFKTSNSRIKNPDAEIMPRKVIVLAKPRAVVVYMDVGGCRIDKLS